MCNQWYDLGRRLGVRLETISTDSRDQLLEMLKTWLTTSDNTSLKTLTDALKTMGANRLAGDLERKYCLTKDMRESKH